MRLLVSAVAGIAIALLLFLVMSSLIAGNGSALRNPDERLNLDFIQLDLNEVENIRRRTPPPEPKQVARLPTLPRLTLSPQDTELPSMPRLDIPSLGIDGVQLNSPLEYGSFDGSFQMGGLNEDGDLYPILRVEPVYPTAARVRSVNGWVDLEYTVLANGSVADVVVLQSEPMSTFDESAVAAISKWRFKPRVVNGQAVPARVEQRIFFNVLN